MLLRFDPFQELDRMTEQMRRTSQAMLSFDAVRDDHEVVIEFDVPGVDGDDIDVTVENNELTITAERPWRDDDHTVVAAERPHGTFRRQLMLGDTLDVEELKADLDRGVLTVRIPVSEKSRQRKISVGAGSSSSEAIDASSSDRSKEKKSKS